MRVIVQIRQQQPGFQVLAVEDVDEGFDMTVFVRSDRYYLSMQSVQRDLEHFMEEPVSILPVVIRAGAALPRPFVPALTE